MVVIRTEGAVVSDVPCPPIVMEYPLLLLPLESVTYSHALPFGTFPLRTVQAIDDAPHDVGVHIAKLLHPA